MVFRKGAKVALDSQNDDQSPIDKLIPAVMMFVKFFSASAIQGDAA
jgi:hypothetical protein